MTISKSVRLRSAKIMSYLEKLYPNPDIPLDHSNEFTLLIAVLLSAQSTDKKVNEVTKELFKLASSPTEMKNLGLDIITKSIKQLGLYRQKAKNIYSLSNIIIEDFHGEVPTSLKDLESLPGVGHKTACVLVSQAFGIPSFPIDTHIHRLAQRWELTSGKNVKETEKDLKNIFPVASWNKLHLQIIYYGREHCTARGCDGTLCDLCRTLFPKRVIPINCKKA